MCLYPGKSAGLLEKERCAMVEKVRLVPETADSHPFAPGGGQVRFAGNGYVEEEFFVYGKANLYDADETRRPM